MGQFFKSIAQKYQIQLVFAGAFIIRLIGLNQSLWLDEATTARVVKEYTMIGLIRQFSQFDFHPPLYYICMKIWTAVVGYSEIALRMPSVIFSLIAGYFIYRTVLYLKNKRTALWAALFFLCNPLIVYYSQEARMYMLTVCLLSMATYFLFIDEKQSRLSIKIYMGVCLAASFAVFYGSIFYSASVLLILLVRRRFHTLFVALLFIILAIVILSPLTISQYMHSQTALTSIALWSNVLGTVTLKNILLIPLKFAVGRISFEPKWLYWLLGGFWSIAVWFIVLKGFLVQKSFAVLCVMPLLLGIIFSFFSPLLTYFRFLYLLIPISIALAYGVTNKKHAYSMLIGFVFFSGLYVLVARFHRENWKDAARVVPSHSIVYGVPSSMDALTYYRSDIKVNNIRTLTMQNAPKTFIVFPYTSELYGINTYTQFRVIRSQDYRGVIVLTISR